MKIVTGNRLNEFWEELKEVLIPKSKVLKTLEEVEANTNEENIAGATALKEVDNKLMLQPEFVYDSNGKITGYKTPGGADTVFPFNSIAWFDSLPKGSHTFEIGAGIYTRTYAFPSGSNVLAIYGFYVGGGNGSNAGNLSVTLNRAQQTITFAGTTSSGFYLTVYYIKAPS